MNRFALLLALALSGCATPELEQADFSAPQGLSDADKDGVIDSRDHCPSTLAGLQVDVNGCSSQQRVAFDVDFQVQFAHNRADVNAQGREQAAVLATYLKAKPNAVAHLSGHTSALGSDSYNEALGMKRAMAVRDILVNQYGIDASRLIIESFGESQLLLLGSDEQSHAANRRVAADTESYTDPVDVVRWSVFTPREGE